MSSPPIGLAFVLVALGACNGGSPADRPDAAMAGPSDAPSGDAAPLGDAAPSRSDAAPSIDAPPSSAPAVVATVPAHQASGVEPAAVIEVTFSRDMAGATIDGGSFTVTHDGVALSGAVTYAPSTRVATFAPQGRLALLGAYTATLTADITDVDGAALPFAHAWTFTVRDGAWRPTALLLDDQQGCCPNPQVALDGLGDALVLWDQRGDVWSARHQVGVGWAAASRFVASGFAPRLAVAPSGHGAMIFGRRDAGDGTVSAWGRHLAPGGAWSAAAPVETDEAYAHHVGELTHLAIDPAGTVTVAWDQDDDDGKNVWARRYTPGAGWDLPTLLETEDARDAGNPWVETDGAGNVTVAWMQSDGTHADIWANRYAAGVGWGTAAPLNTVSAGFAVNVRLAADAAGDVTAVWLQSDGTRQSVWCNRYVAGAGWGTAILLETTDDRTLNAEVAADPDGIVSVVWDQLTDGSLEVWTRRFVPGAGWEAAARLASGANPAVVVDDAGNVIAVWTRGEAGIVSIWARRFVTGAGWSAPVLIDTADVGDSYFPRIAIGPAGNAVVAWDRSVGDSESGSQYRVWAASFE